MIAIIDYGAGNILSVQKALDHIDANACRGIGVADVARHCGVSRALLQLRFRRGDALLSCPGSMPFLPEHCRFCLIFPDRWCLRGQAPLWGGPRSIPPWL